MFCLSGRKETAIIFKRFLYLTQPQECERHFHDKVVLQLMLCLKGMVRKFRAHTCYL